jgi:ribosome-binding factor A
MAVKENRRKDRLAHQIRQDISSILLEELVDQRLSRVVVTDCKLTADLGVARVYFTVLGDEQRDIAVDEATAGLGSARNLVRRELARRLQIKRVPEVVFEYDAHLDEVRRLEELFERVKVKASDDESSQGEGDGGQGQGE